MSLFGLGANPIDVLYFFEHRDRELETAAAVAALLRKRHGRSVAVASAATDAFRLLFRYRPRLVVVPYCYSQNSFPLWVYRKAYGESVNYVSLCVEQVLSEFFKSSKMPADPFSREAVQHLAWNEEFRDWLVGGGVNPQRVTVTGSGQHAFYQQRYQALQPSRAELAARGNLDPGKKWVLLPMQYAGAFFTPEHTQSRLKAGFDSQRMGPYIRFCHDSLNAVLGWILEAAAQMPDVEFIIRPRPNPLESEEGYYKLLRQQAASLPPNIKVIKALPIPGWILQAQAVFSSLSTTLLDAALAGKPAYNLAPCPVPDWLKGQWNNLVPAVATRDEMLKALRRGSVEPPPELAAYVERVYGVGRQDPLERIAVLIDGTLAAPHPAPRPRVALAELRSLQRRRVGEWAWKLKLRRRWLPGGQKFSFELVDSPQIEIAIARAARVIAPTAGIPLAAAAGD